MKKILLSVLLTLALPLVASATLWQYYTDRGQNLPSLEERKPIAAECSILDYQGTEAQNGAMEACLNDYGIGSSSLLGTVSQRPSGFRTTLAESLSATASSTEEIKVVSLKTKEGHTLTDSDVGDFIILTISPGKGNEEKIMCISGTDGTSNWEDCTRGYSYYTQSATATVYAHSPGETVIISDDDAYISSKVAFLGNEQTWSVQQNFSVYPKYSVTTTLPTLGAQLATKYYVDQVGAGGFTSLNIGNGYTLRANGTAPETLDVNTSTASKLSSFLIENGKFVLDTSTDALIDTFWKNSYNATTTKDNLTIEKATTTSLVVGSNPIGNHNNGLWIQGNATTTGSMDVGTLCFGGTDCFSSTIPSGKQQRWLPSYPVATSTFEEGVTADRVYVVPVTISLGIKVDRIKFWYNGGAISRNCSVGLYSLDGNTKILDTGAQVCANTNSNTLDSNYVATTTLATGGYLLAWTANNATIAFTGIAGGSFLINSANNASSTLQGYATNNSTAGALPATLGVITNFHKQIPFVELTSNE